jgi:hypothetical protein
MKINWIGGNLPRIGKSWMVRGLTESIFNQGGIPPIVIDTSINSTLTRVYNPQLLNFYNPSLYFSKDTLVADEIENLARTHKNLVIKLSSNSQPTFLEWLEDTKILSSEIEQHFWFVTNSRQGSIKYFDEVYQTFNPFLHDRTKCTLNIVRNWHNLQWNDNEEIENITTCNLSGIITNLKEIQYIENNNLTLSELASLGNSRVPLIFRSRVMRFINECISNFLVERPAKLAQKETKPSLRTTKVTTLSKQQEDDDDDVPF